jgi:hypothetical protein
MCCWSSIYISETASKFFSSLLFKGNNEEMQTLDFTIGEGASSADPITDERFCFNISTPEDAIKEERESFSLLLSSDDDSVCLGRDAAVAFVLSNGSELSRYKIQHQN